ncbi:MAG: hypothetical protein AAF743_05250 [Planctomycetota bacterium]
MQRRTPILVPILGTVVIHAGVAGSMWAWGMRLMSESVAIREVAETSFVPVYVDEPPAEIKSVWGEASSDGDALNSLEAPLPQSGPVGFQNQARTSPNAGRPLPPQPERAARPPGGGFVVPNLPGRMPKLPEPSEQQGEDPSNPTPADESAEPSKPQSDDADNAAPGDTALDGTTTTRAVTFTNGAADARFGRRSELAPGKYYLAIREEIGFKSFPIVARVEITLDDNGNVLDVRFRQRTPSPALDRTLEIALYSSWFEPVVGEPTFDATFVWLR